MRDRAYPLLTMPNPLVTKTADRVPGLRRLPVAKLLAIGELVLLAHQHVGMLDAAERRRFFQLMRRARGRRHNLTNGERAELASLVAKANPRLFLGLAAEQALAGAVAAQNRARQALRAPARASEVSSVSPCGRGSACPRC